MYKAWHHYSKRQRALTSLDSPLVLHFLGWFCEADDSKVLIGALRVVVLVNFPLAETPKMLSLPSSENQARCHKMWLPAMILCILDNFACFFVICWIFSKNSFWITISLKQFGRRSGLTKCIAWSWSKLFAKVISRWQKKGLKVIRRRQKKQMEN